MKTTSIFLTLLFLIVTQYLAAQTWSQLTSNYDSALTNVYFVNQNIGYVCGYRGTILKTVNGGTNWVRQNSGGDTSSLAVIQFIDNNIGYASGGFASNCTLLKSINGGDTWTKVSLSFSGSGGGIWFVSADTGFYAHANSLYGSSVISKTTNGGASWNVVYSGTGWISYFYFTDSKNGFATVSGGTVLKTTDGGQNWTPSTVGTNLWGSGLYFFNKDVGFVGGGLGGVSDGAIYKTVNGGTSWQLVNSGNPVFKLFFADINNGYALSVNSTGAGKLIKSIDGGANWVNETTPKDNLRGIYFLNTNLGYVVGDNGVILKYSLATSVKDNLLKADNNIILYPNPFSTYATIRINEDIISKNLSIKICNLLGIELKVIDRIDNNEIIIDRGNLPSGIYFYELTSANKIIGKGKFIIE
jgi:photosystem II stability/assembly factor-like uncharacterized protein